MGAYELELEEGNPIPVDVAYGGNFYVITEARDLGTRVRRKRIGELIRMGIMLRDRAAEQIEVQHPGFPWVPKKVDLARAKNSYYPDSAFTCAIYSFM